MERIPLCLYGVSPNITIPPRIRFVNSICVIVEIKRLDKKIQQVKPAVRYNLFTHLANYELLLLLRSSQLPKRFQIESDENV